MRIMILVPGLPVNMDKIKGGVHSAVANLLRGFAAHDVQVRAIAFSREVKEETLVHYFPNVDICYVPEGPFPFHSLNYFFKAPGLLKQQIKAFKPDIIHYEEGNTFLFSKLFGLRNTRYLQTIHGMSFAEAKRKKTFKDKITWYFNGTIQLLLNPDNIIHLSNFSKNRNASRKSKRTAIIPNSIVPAYFNVPLKEHTENKLLYAGIIDNNKNLIFLLGAMKKLIDKNKPYTLDVLGDYSNDMYKALIQDYIKENKLEANVRFQGWVPQTTVLKFVQDADILVVSSKHESLPMVIAESMAAGKVVAASAVGGIPEMIQHKVNGFLFDVAEPDQLVNILEELYNNNNQISTIARKAKATAIERYQCENVAGKTIEFYKECLK